mmetsp:Transcript_21953/g.35312  ORF Transcript_21953/g.35312 Transcript_21953/m.35312 type:complete len:408 (-) Transcript_21953:297-1520(-)
MSRKPQHKSSGVLLLTLGCTVFATFQILSVPTFFSRMAHSHHHHQQEPVDDLSAPFSSSTGSKSFIPFSVPSQLQDLSVSYEQFVHEGVLKSANNQNNNQRRSSSSSSSTTTFGPPHPDQWLLDGRKRNKNNDETHQERIPKKLFKVNLQHDGQLQNIFGDDLKGNTNNNNETSSTIPPALKEAHLSWRLKNPDYDITYFNLVACRQYIKKYFHPIFLRAFDCIQAYTGKGNLFKYLVIYREGGWYSDWKQTCLVDNLLDTLAEGNTTFFSAVDQAISKKPGYYCHQNAFYGATRQHPVLVNVIQRVLTNVQSKFHGEEALQTTGVCVFGPAVKEAGYAEDMVNTSKKGIFMNSRSKFSYQGKFIVEHKCRRCDRGNNWPTGNNYFKLWAQGAYYCPEAATLFESPF